MKNMKGLQSIGEVMPVALKKLGSGRNLNKYTVIVNWEKIVGKEIADNTFISNIDRGTLVLKVKNSVWGHHLMMLKEEMMRKINGYLGENLIKDIWFMAGYDKDNQNYKSMESYIKKSPLIPVKLKSEEIEAVKLIAGGINDSRIKAGFIRLLIKDMAREKAKKDNNWQTCLNCEVLVPPEKKYCTVCLIDKNKKNFRENKKRALEKMLKESPWLSYKEIKKNISTSLEEYNAAKESLACFYTKKIFNEDGGKIFRADLVMLLKEIKPENLNQALIDDVIGEVEKILLKKGGEKYVSAPRS